jgi:hypothetical protein
MNNGLNNLIDQLNIIPGPKLEPTAYHINSVILAK